MEVRTHRPAADEHAAFEAAYLTHVPAGDIVDILAGQVDGTLALLRGIPDDRADFAYAPGKWSVREVVGHVCDAERVHSYRALRFARGDRTPLPGFDENSYVAAGRFGARPIASLLDELAAVRRATVALLAGLDAEAWTRRGTANGVEHSVLAQACIIAGHELHHRALLLERYGLASTAPHHPPPPI